MSRRITWRVILIVSIISAVIMALTLVFVFVVSIILSAMRGQYVTDGISGRMETMLRAVEISAANNVAEIEAHLDSPETVFGALEHELLLNKKYLGCFVAFEPDRRRVTIVLRNATNWPDRGAYAIVEELRRRDGACE